MDRTSLNIQLSKSAAGLGHFHLSILTHRWSGGEIAATDEIVSLNLTDVPEYQGTDPLAWVQQINDEIYKAVNAERARQLDTGWISGTCGTSGRASETPPPSM